MQHIKNRQHVFGLVIRDHKGIVEAVMVENIKYCFDAEHAETLAF